MAIGYSDNIRSQVVQICTPELLHQALKSYRVKTVCAQLADALESKLRGEICNDDYEEMKKKLKSQLPILTPHATFRNGRRKNDEAIPSGLSIYDIDHIPNPRGYWEEKKKVLAGKLLGGTKFSGGVLAEAGSESGGTKVSGDLQSPASCGQARNVLSVLDLIVLVHVTPSTQGLRLVFVIPEGMDIAMAQRWMSQQLEDSEYDTVVKDLARPSFLVPEEYLLYINEEELFKERKITSTSSALPGGGASLLAGDCKSPGRLAGFNSDVQSEDDEYPAPPPMPEKLPKLVELLVSKTPDIYKPAVACAIFPPLATHLWRTRFRYIDNVEHEATLSVCLLAGTGAGKSCVQMPINYIMEDIRKRDKENMRREKEWKDEMVRKGANKDKRKRPENLIIQEIDADMTNPAFVMRTAEAQEHFLYTSMNELDQFDALRGMGNQQFRIMCLAFDPGNTFGQQRVGIQSVTERVTIRFNWNASSTIDKGQRYFSKVLIDGPLSRINFCTIPEREIGEDIPVYGTYDEAYRTALKPYIENLCMATGLVDCPEAFQLATVLKNENAEFARTSQNRIYENFSFRANVIAYLKACVLYVANGFKWEPEIDDFIRWSERYDLWCKMRFFGDMIAKEMNSAERSSKRGPENLLQLLPDVFTLSQLEALRLEHGLEQKGTKGIIRQWVHRQYIERIKPQGEDGRDSYSCDSFRKLKYRHDL